MLGAGCWGSRDCHGETEAGVVLVLVLLALLLQSQIQNHKSKMPRSSSSCSIWTRCSVLGVRCWGSSPCHGDAQALIVLVLVLVLVLESSSL